MVSPWLTGALGWAFGGPLGGLFGFAAGALFSALQQSAQPQTSSRRPRAPVQESSNFMASLLVLTAAMMKADGCPKKSELDVVKKFFIEQFGIEIAQDALQELRALLKKNFPIYPISRQIRDHMNYSQRMALLHFLFSIAYADGILHPGEDRLLEIFAHDLGLRAPDIRSIAAMFSQATDPDADYTVLEIESTATDDEIRKAYRRMSMKHHPDKVAHLGPTFQKTATEKFQRVNAAYSSIKKSRNMT